MMKILSLCIALCLVLVGCGKNDATVENSLQVESSSQSNEDSESSCNCPFKKNGGTNYHPNEEAPSESSGSTEESSDSARSTSFEEGKQKTLKELSDEELAKKIQTGMAPLFNTTSFGNKTQIMSSLGRQGLVLSEEGSARLDAFMRNLGYMRGEVFVVRTMETTISDRSDVGFIAHMTIKRAYSPSGTDATQTANHLYKLLETADEEYQQKVSFVVRYDGEMLVCELPIESWYN